MPRKRFRLPDFALFLRSATGIAIANHRNRCDFGALRYPDTVRAFESLFEPLRGHLAKVGKVTLKPLRAHFAKVGRVTFKSLFVSVATPAEPRGEKKLFLCKFWAVKNF